MKDIPQNRGFIRAIVAIALALVVLRFVFGIDALNIFNDPRFDPIFSAVFAWTENAWEAYIFPIVSWIVKYAVIAWQFIWEMLVAIGAKLKEWGLTFYPEFLRFW